MKLMKAMRLHQHVSLAEVDEPLELDHVEIPQPEPGEVLIRVSACGVCHTELDEIEGRVPPSLLPIVLGHQVVGRVESLGANAADYQMGDRVGVGWIYSSSGGPDENLVPAFRATGRDANGGYAQFMTVPQRYAYPIPSALSDVEAAPLLCAGAIGYRAMTLTGLKDGQLLGLMGFGGSGHQVLQLARHLFPNSSIFVFDRGEAARRLAVELGADWVGEISDRSPEPLHAIIDTTPAWRPVLKSLENLRPGGRLVINAIRKEDGDKRELLELSYQDNLWMEREIKSVANITSHDIREFLPLAASAGIRPATQTYSLEQANRALVELKRAPVRGAKVLIVD